MKRLMKIETLAEYLDASPNKVREMVKQRKLPPPRIDEPRFVRWDRKQVDDALDRLDDPVLSHRDELERRFGTSAERFPISAPDQVASDRLEMERRFGSARSRS